MSKNNSLPQDLAQLSHRNLTTVSVRLHSEDVKEMQALIERLNGPTRGALLRLIVREGMTAVWRRLERHEGAVHGQS